MKGLSFLKDFKPPSDVTEAEVDLDIRPFMNVLLILIPFLASVAVYTRLTILEMSLPPNVGSGMSASEEKPKVKLTVVLGVDAIMITSGELMLDSIRKINDEYDFAGLKEKLLLRREKADVQDEAIVAVNDPIAFKYVVKAMDACRESGFNKVGLAAAAADPEKGF